MEIILNVIHFVFNAVSCMLGLWLMLLLIRIMYIETIRPITKGMTTRELLGFIINVIAGALGFYIVLVLLIGLAPMH